MFRRLLLIVACLLCLTGCDNAYTKDEIADCAVSYLESKYDTEFKILDVSGGYFEWPDVIVEVSCDLGECRVIADDSRVKSLDNLRYEDSYLYLKYKNDYLQETMSLVSPYAEILSVDDYYAIASTLKSDFPADLSFEEFTNRPEPSVCLEITVTECTDELLDNCLHNSSIDLLQITTPDGNTVEIRPITGT